MKWPQINPRPRNKTHKNTYKQRTKGKRYLFKKNNKNTISIEKRKN